jgi:hypothetical protein
MALAYESYLTCPSRLMPLNRQKPGRSVIAFTRISRFRLQHNVEAYAYDYDQTEATPPSCVSMRSPGTRWISQVVSVFSALQQAALQTRYTHIASLAVEVFTKDGLQHQQNSLSPGDKRCVDSAYGSSLTYVSCSGLVLSPTY